MSENVCKRLEPVLEAGRKMTDLEIAMLGESPDLQVGSGDTAAVDSIVFF